MKSIEIAQGFLDLAAEEGRSLSNLPLQKLVFFAHGVHLAAYDTPLTDETARAWNFGPVFPELYETLRKFGRGRVTETLDANHHALAPNTSSEDVIRAVWDAYKKHASWELVKLSHEKGTPWDTVWNVQNSRYGDIPNELIKNYYSSDIIEEPLSA